MTNYYNNVKVIQDDPAPNDCLDFGALMNLMMTMLLLMMMMMMVVKMIMMMMMMIMV